MAKAWPLRPRPLEFWLTPITRRHRRRSLRVRTSDAMAKAQAITPKAAYVLAYAHNALTGAEVGV